MKPLKKIIPLAVFAALGCGLIGTAQADSLASSILNITNYKLSNDSTGTALNNVTDVTITGGNNFGSLKADLNSVPGDTSSTQDQIILAPGGGAFNGTAVCEGSGCNPVTADNYSQTALLPPPLGGTEPSNTYAYADNNLQGASIDLDTDGNGTIDIAAGLTAQTRADVGLNSLDNGTSNSTTGTNVSFTFKALTDITMRLSFNYVAQALSYVKLGSTPTTATANVAWSFLLTDEDVIDPLTGVGTVTEYKPGVLNINTSRNDANAQFSEFQRILNSGSLSTTFSLIAGHNYSIAVGHQTQANARNAVAAPEPEALVLLGIGLLAMWTPMQLRRKV